MFVGQVWVNARIVGDRVVTAKIGGTVCGTARPPFITPTDGGAPTYGLSVSSAEALPGCGREGGVITFFVGDEQVPQTAIWHAGEFEGLGLIIGSPFARFSGGISVNRDRLPAGDTIVPYIGNASCGYTMVAPTGDGYGGVAFSDLQQGDCGVEGSKVTFKLLDAQGNVVAVANQTGVWHAWDGVSELQQLNLIFGPTGITLGNTGTGDGSDGGSPWSRLAIMLGLVGFAGVAGGFGFRRRAMRR
jgi:hypothetical protein